MSIYKPEGYLLESAENRQALKSIQGLQDALDHGKILEGRAVVCDADHNLIVDLGCMKGVIPRHETAVGIDDGTTRDIAIISRVNKPVCFRITGFKHMKDGTAQAMLSRRTVQQQCMKDYIQHLQPGDIIPAKVTHLEQFGCFVDIGCGIPSLVPIDSISVSRISHPRDRFTVGQNIKVIVKEILPEGRIVLTHKELLGTWEENAALFAAGETVAGIVRSVEDYGVFVELTPNLAGLAEPKENVYAGQQTSVYIKSLIPQKMKVKLIIVDAFDAAYKTEDPVYFIQDNHIDSWRYSPSSSERIVETIFGDSLEDDSI
ncbi:S1 RNA-binding domain-containing protein [Candidatus Soleaferrea massiliensis]|uniref:S1 RNA-binding domain-containing protein n=1 Tax=Candidatus Soleaferrea massiliensis TaxID=1470354 RepID=UPI00058B23B5|nr:S1 RNA-binding domain-containing protein [Candidatus Soleaferrea massiliensis]